MALELVSQYRPYSKARRVCVTVAVSGEHAKVLSRRPPHCGPRRPHKKTTTTATTDSVSTKTKHYSRTSTPTTSATVSSASAAVDEHLSVNLLNIHDTSRPSSVESESSSSPTTTTTTTRKRDSPQSDAGDGSLSHDDVPASKHSLRSAAWSLDNVDLWEDSADRELRVLTAVATMGGPASQTCVTTADYDERERHTVKRVRQRRRWNRRHNQHHTSCRLSQQNSRPTTSAVDASTGSDWRCPSTTQDAASAAACISRRGFIPSIIESSGRPATANRSAADLSHGSVELHQRRTGAGLNLFIRGMQLRLIGNRDRSTTKSDGKVTEAKVTHLNDVTSQRHHSTIDRLRLVSRLSCTT